MALLQARSLRPYGPPFDSISFCGLLQAATGVGGIWVSFAAMARHPSEFHTFMITVSLTVLPRHVLVKYQNGDPRPFYRHYPDETCTEERATLTQHFAAKALNAGRSYQDIPKPRAWPLLGVAPMLRRDPLSFMLDAHR